MKKSRRWQYDSEFLSLFFLSFFLFLRLNLSWNGSDDRVRGDGFLLAGYKRSPPP